MLETIGCRCLWHLFLDPQFCSVICVPVPPCFDYCSFIVTVRSKQSEVGGSGSIDLLCVLHQYPRGEWPCDHWAGESPDSSRPPLTLPCGAGGRPLLPAELGWTSRVHSPLTLAGGGSFLLSRDERPSSYVAFS